MVACLWTEILSSLGYRLKKIAALLCELILKPSVKPFSKQQACTFHNTNIFVVKSEFLTITCGVPQGTVLGPKLFVILINGDKCSLVSNFKFVDDKTLALSYSGDQTEILQQALDIELVETYKDKMKKSPLADLNNISLTPGGGSCTAAGFLSNFTTSNSWMHLDIAGVMSNEGEVKYLGKGMSGRPTRTMVKFVGKLSI